MRSMSSMVFSSSRVSRREPWATSWGRPMASRTWLGSREPEVHADPEDAATPLSSSRSRRDSPSMPSKQKLTLPGRRRSRSPFSSEWGMGDSFSMRASRRPEI